ncbi:MAG: LysM peptidoglycan-binding domain-containing protein [candidate division KSB1 bacterium]|jgi:nucleoid-associated protein YgaU|nr:LysM peptidoglycan-binding domain-containing protein [candidate division KSB1 bacterium]
MIKFIMKGVIFVLGIQSLMGNLQKQNIIEGEIRINYDVLQQKIVSIAQSEEVSALFRKLGEANAAEYEPSMDRPDEYRYERRDAYQPQERRNYNNRLRNESIKLCRHTVRSGDTLSDLAQEYGVSWKVIKKANRIADEHRLRIGENLVIPTRMA